MLVTDLMNLRLLAHGVRYRPAAGCLAYSGEQKSLGCRGDDLQKQGPTEVRPKKTLHRIAISYV